MGICFVVCSLFLLFVLCSCCLFFVFSVLSVVRVFCLLLGIPVGCSLFIPSCSFVVFWFVFLCFMVWFSCVSSVLCPFLSLVLSLSFFVFVFLFSFVVCCGCLSACELFSFCLSFGYVFVFVFLCLDLGRISLFFGCIFFALCWCYFCPIFFRISHFESMRVDIYLYFVI